MIWLHRSDDSHLRKALKIFCCHVLRVLDAESTVTDPIHFRDVFKQIEYCGDGAVTYGMNAELQSGTIGFSEPRAHTFQWLHLVGEKAAVVGLIAERLEHRG